MNTGSCVYCGQPLDERSRQDRRTCSGRCHMAVWRRRKALGGHRHGTADPMPTGAPSTDSGRCSRNATSGSGVALAAEVERDG